MPIASLREGEAIVVGRVLRVKDGRGRAPLTATLQDETGAIQAKWFGRRYLSGRIAPGDRLFIAGRVTRAGLLPEINVSTHRVLREDERWQGEIVPVYAASKDLPTRTIRTAIAKNLDRLIAARADVLPADSRATVRLSAACARLAGRARPARSRLRRTRARARRVR